jgi:hypothetical protein
MVMSNNKQTSVEQLFHKLWDTPKDKFTWYAILEEHMEMHKSEIIWAHGIKMKGVNNLQCVSGEQYYNERYGDDKQ